MTKADVSTGLSFITEVNDIANLNLRMGCMTEASNLGPFHRAELRPYDLAADGGKKKKLIHSRTTHLDQLA